MNIMSDKLLEGKIAIITGASRGIGAQAARVFVREGATVVLAARSEGGLNRTVDEIQAGGGYALAVPTDVGDPTSVERLVNQTLQTYGHLDIAFNNAGEGHMPVPLANLAIDDFDRAVRVNLRGVFLAMKFEIPAMLATGGGAIVNMGSTAGLNGVRGIAGYVAGKHGIIGLTKTAALDYAGQGIRVNVIAPGPVLTERIESLSEEARQPIKNAVPLGRIGLPEEIAWTAAWLCSEQASFITGAVLPVDGGRLAGIA
jgi:NAD(P)-dependent dehydrogenase (short-subunit alcohol dehydrogenase family)